MLKSFALFVGGLCLCSFPAAAQSFDCSSLETGRARDICISQMSPVSEETDVTTEADVDSAEPDEQAEPADQAEPEGQSDYEEPEAA